MDRKERLERLRYYLEEVELHPKIRAMIEDEYNELLNQKE